MDIVETFIKTVEAKNIVLSKERYIRTDFDLIELLEIISRKEIVIRLSQFPYITKAEFMKEKVKPYGSRHIVSQSNRVIPLYYSINEKIYTFYIVEDKVYLCKDSQKTKKTINEINSKLSSKRATIRDNTSILEKIDKMSKEEIIKLLQNKLDTSMTEYKLDKSSRTRLREDSKEILIKIIKEERKTLEDLPNSIGDSCIELGLGKTPTYRLIIKGIRIAIDREYELYISKSLKKDTLPKYK